LKHTKSSSLLTRWGRKSHYGVQRGPSSTLLMGAGGTEVSWRERGGWTLLKDVKKSSMDGRVNSPGSLGPIL